jgi:hypothetical protein
VQVELLEWPDKPVLGTQETQVLLSRLQDLSLAKVRGDLEGIDPSELSRMLNVWFCLSWTCIEENSHRFKILITLRSLKSLLPAVCILWLLSDTNFTALPSDKGVAMSYGTYLK